MALYDIRRFSLAMSSSLVKYSLSEAAYSGLYDKLVTAPREAFPTTRRALSALRSRTKAERFYDGYGVAVSRSKVDTHKEGVSTALNWLYLLYQDFDRWSDTRPNHIKLQHEQELHPSQDLIDLGIVSPVYENNWYLQAYKEDLEYIEQDDTPWEQLQDNERQLRLSLPVNRKRRLLSITEQARTFYHSLAKHFKMAPYSDSHAKTTYVAACLEAIGIGWLSPPDNYKGLLIMVSNSNKHRPQFTYNGHNHHMYGNHAHIAFDPTVEDIKHALSPLPPADPNTYTLEELEFYRKFPDRYAEFIVGAEEYFTQHPELLEKTMARTEDNLTYKLPKPSSTSEDTYGVPNSTTEGMDIINLPWDELARYENRRIDSAKNREAIRLLRSHT